MRAGYAAALTNFLLVLAIAVGLSMASSIGVVVTLTAIMPNPSSDWPR